MMKKLMLISSPLFTRSGYGEQAKDIVKALFNEYRDTWDIKLMSQPWGNTPMNNVNYTDDAELVEAVLKTPELPKRPDCFIQITVPNEFQPIGTHNIGITAATETTTAPVEFIDGCNKMNTIIVPSEFTKQVLEKTIYHERNQQGEVVREHKLARPVKVLFEGTNPDLFYYKSVKKHPDLLKGVKEDFAFLFIGHWLKGDIGHDRKDVGMLIKTFLATFKNKPKKPALILKTSSATFSVIDRENILGRIRKIREQIQGDLPNIYLIHGDLTHEEMGQLMNDTKVKAHVSFTKGEGFGRPLLEASLSGKPVIASNWSGHIDFLDESLGAVLLNGELAKVHPSASDKFIMSESTWYNVDYSSAARVLLDVYNNYDKYDGKKLADRNVKEFSLEKMQAELKKIIDEIDIPTMGSLNLPKLKKVGGSDTQEAPKLKLPKLKKV